MTRDVHSRLRRLEADAVACKARLHVIEGDTPAARDSCVSELIQSGKAKATDMFIHTGVPRAGKARPFL